MNWVLNTFCLFSLHLQKQTNKKEEKNRSIYCAHRLDPMSCWYTANQDKATINLYFLFCSEICICITDRLGDNVEEVVIVYTVYNITILHILSASEKGKKEKLIVFTYWKKVWLNTGIVSIQKSPLASIENIKQTSAGSQNLISTHWLWSTAEAASLLDAAGKSWKFVISGFGWQLFMFTNTGWIEVEHIRYVVIWAISQSNVHLQSE